MSLTVAVLGLVQSGQQDGKFHCNKSVERRIYLDLSIFRFFIQFRMCFRSWVAFSGNFMYKKER
jgi:hypothetical protein